MIARIALAALLLGALAAGAGEADDLKRRKISQMSAQEELLEREITRADDGMIGKQGEAAWLERAKKLDEERGTNMLAECKTALAKLNVKKETLKQLKIQLGWLRGEITLPGCEAKVKAAEDVMKAAESKLAAVEKLQAGDATEKVRAAERAKIQPELDAAKKALAEARATVEAVRKWEGLPAAAEPQ